MKKKLAEQFSCDSREETEEERLSTSSLFSSKQILNQYKKDRKIAPTHPTKKIRSHRQPFQKIQINDSSHGKQRSKEEERIESEPKRMKRADITYTTPGRRDTVYVAMDHSKRQYKQKIYLLGKIRDLIGLINALRAITNKQYGSFPETFQQDLSFRQLYEFLKGHKDLARNDQIPQSFCICELCKKALLLAKGINSSLRSKILKTNVHDLLSRAKCLRFKPRYLHGLRV